MTDRDLQHAQAMKIAQQDRQRDIASLPRRLQGATRSRVLSARQRIWMGIALIAQLAAGTHARANEPQRAAPARIVSLNQCLDAILVELVPTQRIAAISHYSRDPLRSPIAALAARLPITYETAEEIVALRPDLVLASRHSAIPTRNALRRVGVHYELFDVPFSVADSVAQIRRIAALVGNAAEGEALVARIEHAIDVARLPAGARRLTAAVYETGGLTAGSSTVTDDLMRIVGFDNLAARYGIKTHLPMPLELIVATPPDVLLVGDIPASAGTQAARIVQHRALRKLPSARREFPARFMYCSGPTIVEEVAALATARDSVYAISQARASR